MRYLLDTNIMSVLVRDPHGRVATRVVHHGMDRVCTSIVVAAELRYGVARVNSRVLAQALDRHFEYLNIVPLEAPADAVYGAIRADLARRGQLIGPNDLLIAAQALALGCVLVTDNEREFGRVKGLRIENWLR